MELEFGPTKRTAIYALHRAQELGLVDLVGGSSLYENQELVVVKVLHPMSDDKQSIQRVDFKFSTDSESDRQKAK